MRKEEELIMKRDRKEELHQKFKAKSYESYMPKFLNCKNFINFIFFSDSLHLKVSQRAQFFKSLSFLLMFPLDLLQSKKLTVRISCFSSCCSRLWFGEKRAWYLAFGLADLVICSSSDFLLCSSEKLYIFSSPFLVDFYLVLTFQDVFHGKISVTSR